MTRRKFFQDWNQLTSQRISIFLISAILVFTIFGPLPSFAKEIIFVDPDIADQLPDWVNDIVDISTNPPPEESQFLDVSSEHEEYTRPTFGLDHIKNEKIIDSGFRINNQTYSINDNFYTPFEERTIEIGHLNSFEAKVYASKGLKIQEFLFGIPGVGHAHEAEVGVEVWLGEDGNIQQTKVIQKNKVVDESSLVATHEKSKCLPYDINEKCDLVIVSIKFLEPLRDKIMALKAIDFKRRYQITYLNEGIYISGDSLNPMKTEMIPSGLKGGGLIQVTQISKYSPFWKSDDGRLFEKNRFSSFKENNFEFERFHDLGDAKTRSHSDYGLILNYEKERATKTFDASKILSKLPETFHYDFKITERMNDEVKNQMKLQEQIAIRILEESNKQTRY